MNFASATVHRPTTIAELQAVVASAASVRALGTGHSFNRIADTTGALVLLDDLPRQIDVDSQARTVTVAGGIRYGELAAELDRHGVALHNMGSLPHISVAGACATGTHGSGDRNGNLATAVRGLELVTAAGDITTLARSDDGAQFPGAVISLGCLGIVTSLTLDVVPAYQISQTVYENLAHDRLDDGFDAIMSGGYSVSLFTDWQRPVFDQVWRKSRVETPDPHRAHEQPATPPDWHGATAAPGPRHPLPGLSDRAGTVCTEQLGVPGLWNQRLPHFRLEFTPSHGEELQSEYLLPRVHAVAALRAVAELGSLLAPVLQVSEVRTVAADDLWLSPSFERDCVAIHFTWVKDETAVGSVLVAVEDRLAEFGARPHWGKVFVMAADQLAPLYPRLDDFVRLIDRFDPGRKFRNRFVDACLGRP